MNKSILKYYRQLSPNALIVGAVFDFACSFIIVMAISFYYFVNLSMIMGPENFSNPIQQKLAVEGVYIYMLVPLLIGVLLMDLLGGYITGSIAKKHELVNGVGMYIILNIINVLTLIVVELFKLESNSSEPSWFIYLHFTATPVLIILGAYLAKLVNQRSVKITS